MCKYGLDWQSSRYLFVNLQHESDGGAGVVKQFALDMRQAFPNETGFSDTNVKYMKRWYSFYSERVTKSHQLGDQLEDEKSQQVADQIESTEKGQQVADQLEMPEVFGKVPWFHHVQIFSHCGTLDEALFYINKIIEEGWSRSWLEDQIAANLFLLQGSAVTNFSQTLPLPQSQATKARLEMYRALLAIVENYPCEYAGTHKVIAKKNLSDSLDAAIKRAKAVLNEDDEVDSRFMDEEHKQRFIETLEDTKADAKELPQLISAWKDSMLKSEFFMSHITPNNSVERVVSKMLQEWADIVSALE